ncbi:hypothetical protein C0995_002672 [Termitomyces sp. Mi166|nr:hypothetical protein C0995_002672 [Termitomyces sp. Mi166\
MSASVPEQLVALPDFHPPHPPNRPPPGYADEDISDWNYEVSDTSGTMAFKTGIDERDTFLGERRCIICGARRLKRCHIIRQSEHQNMTSRKYILVNYSDHPDLQKYHGKVIALDVSDRYAPFPSLFIVHEMRVRGRHPFHVIRTLVPAQPAFQDWVYTDGVFDPNTNSFIRAMPSGGSTTHHLQPLTESDPTTSTGAP